MKLGIASKLATTYIAIIITTLFSGAFCFYVFENNHKANEYMRQVTIPSLEYIKEMKGLFPQIKKLSGSIVFVANKKEKEKLSELLFEKYPELNIEIEKNAQLWKNEEELQQLAEIKKLNNLVLASAAKISLIMNTEEDIMNDSLVDAASNLYDSLSYYIKENNTHYKNIIDTKNKNLNAQINTLNALHNYLYVALIGATLIIILVSSLSMRYSNRQIVKPILALNNTILEMATGEVSTLASLQRADEIGQIHNAIGKLIDGLMLKIQFAEQIGAGHYNSEFHLLSYNDKLGIALLSMRNNLKQSTEKLKESERRLQEAQKLAKLGNFYIDLKTLHFQSSANLDEILGLSADFNKRLPSISELIISDKDTDIEQKYNDALSNRKQFAEQFLIKRPDNLQPIWISANGEFRYNEQGEAIVMFGSAQDITESKQLELDLNSSIKIAEEQNKRLLNFSYIVSHNLRMHTVNIQSLLELIEETEDEQERKEITGLLITASNLLSETMLHLNEVVNIQNPLLLESSKQNLYSYIRNVIYILDTQIKKKNAVINTLVAEDIEINYNPAYLDSILLNLISNALKYSSPDRQPNITIDCKALPVNAERHQWALTIKDNGLGIDMTKNGHKLFGMYKTFHGNADAKGIGLFITKNQIESMGGSISVESAPNEGTTFIIKIA